MACDITMSGRVNDEEPTDMDEDEAALSRARQQALGFPQQELVAAVDGKAWLQPSEPQEQLPQPVDEEAIDLLIAAQKALPKASSAHAGQFEGSPVQEAGVSVVEIVAGEGCCG